MFTLWKRHTVEFIFIISMMISNVNEAIYTHEIGIEITWK